MDSLSEAEMNGGFEKSTALLKLLKGAVQVIDEPLETSLSHLIKYCLVDSFPMGQIPHISTGIGPYINQSTRVFLWFPGEDTYPLVMTHIAN